MINEDGLAIRVLNVDSRTRVNGRAEDCEIQLNEPIAFPPGAAMWCTGINVPLAWPVISSMNNRLHVTEYVDEPRDQTPYVDAAGVWLLSGTNQLLEETDTPFRFIYHHNGPTGNPR